MAAALSGSANQSAPPQSTAWGLVILMQAIGMVASFPVGKVPPSLPQLQAELSLSLFMAGWVISSFNLLAVVSSGAAGALADWWGHRRLVLFGLMFQMFGSLVGSFASGPYLLLASRAAEGVGFISVAVSCPVLIYKVTRPRDRRMAMGIWSSFLPAGAALMMALSPWLLDTMGWRILWQANSGVCLFGLIVFASLTKGLSRTASQRPLNLGSLLADLLIVMRSRAPLMFAVTFACYTLMFISMTGFMPILLLESGRVDPADAAVLSAIVMFMNVLGNLSAGYLLKRGVDRSWLLAAGFLCMGLCSLGIYNPGLSLASRYILCLFFTGCGGLIPASIIEGAASTAPSPALVATSQGLLMQGGQVGQLLGPPALAAVVSAYGGWSAAPWFLISAALAGLIIAWLVRRLAGRSG